METMNIKNVYAAIHARAAAEVEPEPRSRDLDELLRGGNVVMNYQPQFDLKTGAVRGLEALLRAKDAHGRPLNPAELIDRAERGAAVGRQLPRNHVLLPIASCCLTQNFLA